MNDLAERGLGLPDRSRSRSALAKLSAMTLVAVTEPADSEPKPPTRRKMTPSHMMAFRNRSEFDTVEREYRSWIRLGNQEGTQIPPCCCLLANARRNKGRRRDEQDFWRYTVL